MGNTSNDLLLLDLDNSSSKSLESTLLVCEKSIQTQNKKRSLEEKTTIVPIPASQVAKKVKDFLGVISESNARLQLGAKDDHNIEVLTGKETELIEMDLMLGVADLHTPEAVAAAESALAGANQPMTPTQTKLEGSDSQDSSLRKRSKIVELY